MIKLSIITINLNNKKGLEKTIQSILSQTYSNYEYIIIDGHSIDGSVDLIKDIEKNVNYWISEADDGIYQAMNKGIEQAKGEYFLFLNSGDELISDNILEEIFKETHLQDIIYGDIAYQDKSGTKIITSLPERLNLQYFYNASLWHQAAFIKRGLFEKYGGYNENNKLVSDWEFFLKRIIIDKCSYKKINQVVTYYDMYNGLSIKYSDLRIKEMKDIFVQLFPSYILELVEDHLLIQSEIQEIRQSVFYRLYRKYNKLKKHI